MRKEGHGHEEPDFWANPVAIVTTPVGRERAGEVVFDSENFNQRGGVGDDDVN